jgi:putative YhbY family RNA-binding protein
VSELVLDRDHRLALRARAHHLPPVVLLGAAGLSDAALKEIDRALAAHELVKIRAPGDDRDAREELAAQIADRLHAARIQMIGKTLVMYRPRPPEPEVEPVRATREPGRGKRPGGAPTAEARRIRRRQT